MFDLVFILTLYSVIRHKNFYLEYFCIVRYYKILINYSGHRKFTVSLDLNYDPPLLGNHKLAIALITNSLVYIIELQRKLRLFYLIDWLIHWIVFYAVSAISQPYNGRVWFETFMQLLLPLTWETASINKHIKHDMIIPDIISIERMNGRTTGEQKNSLELSAQVS